MRTEHRPHLQDFPYAVLPDWQPAPRWPGAVRVAVIFVLSMACWGLVAAVAIGIAAVLHG